LAVPGEGLNLRRIESAFIAALAVTLSLGAWIWTSAGAEEPPLPTVPTIASASVVTPVVVHVAGAVRHPGVYRLPAGSRVVDAIEAAGGATALAVLSGVNLAAEVIDAAQVVVPTLGHHPSALPDDGLVAVNQASASDLESLPGVGPVLAGRIVSHRDENGPFETPEDLLDVSGIGEAILARLRPLIRVP
jgi:competence protein ComEA